MDVYEIYSEKLKVLGHPVRLKLVHGLSRKECNVTKMAEMLEVPQAIISRHLSLLKNAGIVHGEREGSSICYKVVDDKIKRVLDILLEE
ncbi:transcriptional regulator, ArsR family [Deferribacter desulfuricans SSM1]|uniref:Transcriptional regulator, ArsR family n=1 Tax=Deferribacter desulfuricans (strain DSM 14783 / JCM 11476 / NBRC 101012 / SSM1) TaxID=639282 RepID=D3PAE1_DEFDS|nr:metalloregulator ArsR/SmtB family transcription factor [Deferribacter desulfuricans]BAI79564.1 transcriptional regulator, ArsR family [Deferribacter desulfuricans SSM1]